MKFRLGLAGKAGDKGRANRDLGADLAPSFNALQIFLAAGWALHGLEDARIGMLKRHVDVRQNFSRRHQLNRFVHARIRVNVVQTRPYAKLAERGGQIVHARLDRFAIPEAGTVFHVHAVGGRVLRNHQQLLDARLDQVFRFAHHQANITRHQITTHRRNDAKGTTVVAAFGNLQISIVLGGELDALRRHQIGKRIMRLGQVQMHRTHHFSGRVRARHGQHFRMGLLHHAVLGTKAAGDDHLAVLGEGFTNRVKRFLYGAVDKAAGIDHHQIRSLVGGRDAIALGTQLREDLLGINQRLGTAERDEADLRRARCACGGCRSRIMECG